MQLDTLTYELQDDGVAIVVSSHLLAMVEDLCTHFLVLSRGRPTFCGTHAELFAQHGDEATLEEVFFQATRLAENVTEQLETNHVHQPA